MELYHESIPPQVAELRAAIARGDASAMERAAHAIKGAVANFAARECFEIALRLEMGAREGRLDGAAEAGASLEAAAQRLGDALDALVAQPLAPISAAPGTAP